MNIQVAQEEMDVDKEWVEYLSKRMHDAVMSRIPDVTLNGDHDKRYPGNLNFSFAYVEVSLAMAVNGDAPFRCSSRHNPLWMWKDSAVHKFPRALCSSACHVPSYVACNVA